MLMEMAASQKGSPKPRWGALGGFFTTHIWEVSLAELPRWKASLYRAARIVSSAVRNADKDRLTFRAAALTYFTALSIVPSLAFVFAVVKGFGGYRLLVDETIRPYLERTFAGNEQLLHASEQVLAFVENTNVRSLGAAGLLFLLVTAIGLLNNIETSLNDVWGVSEARPWLRRFTNYVALLVIAPVLTLSAITITTAAQTSQVLAFIRNTLQLGWLLDLVLGFASVLVVSIAMTLLYVLVPNTKTPYRSALLGGVVAGILWHGALILQVQFQLGVARYNALYSSFGAIPIFLFWLFVSWVIVLFGAELAASHQNEHALLRQRSLHSLDVASQEQLAVGILSRVGTAFLQGAAPWNATGLADSLSVPRRAVVDVTRLLCQAGLLAPVQKDETEEASYLPAKTLSALHIKDAVDAVRHGGREEPYPQNLALGKAGELLGAWEAEAARSRHNVSFAELLTPSAGNGRQSPKPELHDS